MLFPQNSQRFNRSSMSGFFAASSGSSESAFVGVEVAAKNGITVCKCGLFGSDCDFVVACGFCTPSPQIVSKKSCSVCTTATNSHK